LFAVNHYSQLSIYILRHIPCLCKNGEEIDSLVKPCPDLIGGLLPIRSEACCPPVDTGWESINLSF